MTAQQPKIVIHFERMEEWPRDATGKMIFDRPVLKERFLSRRESSSIRTSVVMDRMKAN